MTAAWPARDDVAYDLCLQANAIAERLGHEMTTWLPGPTALRSRCMRSGCYAGATVTPRAFSRAPMTGEAVTFACKRR
jgi:hypothetical protein